MIWTPIFCHVLEFQGYLFDLWDRVGERVYSEFLSWLIRYRVWGCGHSALSFTGHQDRQGPRFKGGFLSSEPTQSHEPHCYGLCVCRCYIFSGMYTFFTEVSGMWIFILLLKKRMPFEMSASNKSVLQNLVKQIILSTLRWKILVVRNVRSRSSACVCVCGRNNVGVACHTPHCTVVPVVCVLCLRCAVTLTSSSFSFFRDFVLTCPSSRPGIEDSTVAIPSSSSTPRTFPLFSSRP